MISVRLLGFFALPWVALAVGGCAGAPKASQTEEFFAIPGHYPAAPMGASRPRVGVPAPTVSVATGIASDVNPGQIAADQLFWMLDEADRFNLIERIRLAALMQEQDPGNATRPGRLPHPIALRGIDYLLVCTLSNLSIRGADLPATVSVANVESLLRIKAPKPRITTTCQIEMRLVNPATGAVAASVRDDFRRVCSPEGIGLSFSNPREPFGELRLNKQQATQVVRVALDDAMRKFLPRIDLILSAPASGLAASAPAVQGGSLAHAKANSNAARIQCPECGYECSDDDEFCPNCGARLPRTEPAPGRRRP
ncbi:MAG TPA: zinc-ribbon domain-containing protein [Tepidisphaeraceae bacterium]|nr:zinc-ribbon domain-containing protein [Tepidisphaeraceae bacterium]